MPCRKIHPVNNYRVGGMCKPITHRLGNMLTSWYACRLENVEHVGSSYGDRHIAFRAVNTSILMNTYVWGVPEGLVCSSITSWSLFLILYSISVTGRKELSDF